MNVDRKLKAPTPRRNPVHKEARSISRRTQPRDRAEPGIPLADVSRDPALFKAALACRRDPHAVADGGIEAGAGLFLDFFEHGEQPAEARARHGVGYDAVNVDALTRALPYGKQRLLENNPDAQVPQRPRK